MYTPRVSENSNCLIKQIAKYSDTGQVFYERSIAAEVGLPAAIVHEELLILETNQVIERVPGKQQNGWQVITTSLDQQYELLQMRRSLVSIAATTLAKRIKAQTDPAIRYGICHKIFDRLRLLTEVAADLRPVHAGIVINPAPRPTEEFIRQHAELLVDIAEAAGQKYVAACLTIISWRLTFSRVVYPDPLAGVVEGIGAMDGFPPIVGTAQLVSAITTDSSVEEAVNGHFAWFEFWNRLAAEAAQRLPEETAAAAIVRLSWNMVNRFLMEDYKDRRTLPDGFLVTNNPVFMQQVTEYFSASLHSETRHGGGDGKPDGTTDSSYNLVLLVCRTALMAGHLLVPESERRARHTCHIFETIVLGASKYRLSRDEYSAVVAWRLFVDHSQYAGKGGAERLYVAIGKHLRIAQPSSIRFTLLRARNQLIAETPAPLLHIIQMDPVMKSFFSDRGTRPRKRV